MAAEGGPPDDRVASGERDAILDLLVREGHRFPFFRAVQLIEACAPEAPRVGMQGPASREPVRLRPELSLAFAPSDVRSIRRLGPSEAGTDRLEVTVTFLGLYGPASPLPAHYTEELFEKDPEENLPLQFLDIFHHRALSLLYRAWEKYRYGVRFTPGGSDRMSRLLLLLAGLGSGYEGGSRPIPPLRLLAYAGLLTQRPRSASGLEGILRDFFRGTDVEVEPCLERFVDIPRESRNRLGGMNSRLGVDVSLGERVLDGTTTFRVRIGPVGLREFEDFLPGGASRERLEEIVGVYAADALDYVIELWIRNEEIPAAQLSRADLGLGLVTWLGERPATHQCVRFLVKAREAAAGPA